ncbi:MAG: hypothetical protein KDE58_11255, partial [Caldilineaceae bacterium]|nr:hypothetical protein [Caldilineaceae bacterium]
MTVATQPTSRPDYHLRADWRLLNNGSFGACPKPVFDVYQQWQVEFEQHPGGYMSRQRDELT